MRIVHLNAVNGVLSTGRFCYELTSFLVNNDVESCVLYSTKEKTQYSHKVGNFIENKISAFLTRFTGLNGYFSFNSTNKIIKFLKKYKPNIVHIHNIHANFVNLNYLFKFLHSEKIPIVITLHDCWMYTGGCTHYTLNNCSKWKEECGKCKFFKEIIKSYFFDKTNKMFVDKKNNYLNNEIYVIGVSNWITNEARKSILKNSKEIMCIPNWIDLNKFYPSDYTSVVEKYNLKNKFIILGVASFWNKSKGIEYFVELTSMLNNDEVIVLVGKNILNIENPNIIFIDQTDSIEELRSVYSMANVFLQLSIEETFGLVVLESLACGTPVITNTFTANPDLIDDSIGIILDDLSIDNIYKSIKIIKENYYFYEKNKCVEYVRKRYNKDESLKKYLSLYRRIVEK